MGYTDSNVWLQWIVHTARNSKFSSCSCLACAAARPGLGTVPFPLNPDNDPKGFRCMLDLYKSDSATNCTILKLLFPPVSPQIKPPWFTPYTGNYTCLTRSKGTVSVGMLTTCNTIIDVIKGESNVTDGVVNDQTMARADVWWFCGGKTLRAKLPTDWKGTCAMVQLLMQTYILPYDTTTLEKVTTHNSHITKRNAPAGSFDNKVYIDAIGVPQGVPDEFKARNQVAAGFESLLAWWVTVNKNVDWINYVYYNQQRFLNFTKEAIGGIHQQLDKTSLMAWQNRMALDMLLAEKGGVCRMSLGFAFTLQFCERT
ncbi:uncharacterized protein LOC126393930 [Epinephelus moara]|uniref:uncharacterized protein LOC126393930 n=1 Tax=Epinephelus moara TaxID=300413 RepID=UPI00214E74E5|nr:uncharacterized protein LOC126393930 [Epinephelus moara]XP_049906335.1 uncharacterized protein LOC126393930 [Epinephelus moara]XP_049906336.1 uncharacterized protein LOC126393930 [Epinephelus moara]XP_049906337.1 uncharacterized protein LOC126393930 [Epinephelus moara]XP_049906338.1 uncharacterized protein LOC126393930 [Epinephelus moara]